MPFANNEGIRIYYEVEGVGPPLVLAHGFSLSLEDWRDFGYVKLLRDDYQLILVDARGHGKSDKPHDPPAYAPQLLVADHVAVLDDLAIDKAHLLGYSNGGIVSLCAGRFAPSRFRSVIVGGCQPYADSNRFKHISKPFEKPTLGLPDVPDPLLDLLNRGSAVWLSFMEQNMAIPPSMRKRILAQDFDALRANWQKTHEWRAISEIESLLPHYPLPCLIYVGEADCYPGAKACAQEIPDASFFSLPECSHNDAFVRSDLVGPAVKEFVARFDRDS